MSCMLVEAQKAAYRNLSAKSDDLAVESADFSAEARGHSDNLLFERRGSEHFGLNKTCGGVGSGSV